MTNTENKVCFECGNTFEPDYSELLCNNCITEVGEDEQHMEYYQPYDLEDVLDQDEIDLLEGGLN